MHLCIVLSLMLSEQRLNRVAMMPVTKSIESLGSRAGGKRQEKKDADEDPEEGLDAENQGWTRVGGRKWVIVLHAAGPGRLGEDSHQEVTGALGGHAGDGQSQHLGGGSEGGER